ARPGGAECRGDLLFVYGTLMRGFPLHRLLAAADFVGEGTARGLLFDLGPYPAAVPDPGRPLHGEVYRIGDPSRWARRDSAEGAQYHRREPQVRLTGGREVAAHIYWYAGPVGHGVPIPDGDYRARARAAGPHRLPHEEEH